MCLKLVCSTTVFQLGDIRTVVNVTEVAVVTGVNMSWEVLGRSWVAPGVAVEHLNMINL